MVRMSFPCCQNCSSLSDVVYLRDKEHGSPTHTGVDTSCLPCDSASDITPDKEPNAHCSSVNLEHTDPHVLSDELGGSPPHPTDLNPDRTSHSSVSSQFVSPPFQGVSSQPSQGAGGRASSHYAPSSSSHSCHNSSMNNSSRIVVTSSGPLSNPRSPPSPPTRLDLAPGSGGHHNNPGHLTIQDSAQDYFIYNDLTNSRCRRIIIEHY